MKLVVCAVAAVLSMGTAWADECPPLRLATNVKLEPSHNGAREWVPVEIAGRHKYLLLDTGSPVSTIGIELAHELKLDIHGAASKVFGVTGSYMDHYVVTELAIGTLKSDNIYLMVDKDGPPSSAEAAGILGADILSHYDVSIDFAANKLDLIDKRHCEGRVVYWQKSALAVVPFHLQYTHIVLPVTLDGKNLNALLDTGAVTSALTQPIAEREFKLQLGSTDTPQVGKLNGKESTKTWRHTFRSLSFEGVDVNNPAITIIPDLVTTAVEDQPQTGSRLAGVHRSALYLPLHEAVPDILLGMDVLRNLHVYIAYKEEKLYITPAEVPATTAAKTN
jgi:predicted aspartyl protease